MELETINLLKCLLVDSEESNKSITNISYDNGEGGYYILEVGVEKTYGYDESEIYTFLIDSKTGVLWRSKNISILKCGID